jgi:hypothetical protein
MTDPEALTQRATVISGFRCADDYQVIWHGKERGRQTEALNARLHDERES